MILSPSHIDTQAIYKNSPSLTIYNKWTSLAPYTDFNLKMFRSAYYGGKLHYVLGKKDYKDK